jgi:hypothetical protein
MGVVMSDQSQSMDGSTNIEFLSVASKLMDGSTDIGLLSVALRSFDERGMPYGSDVRSCGECGTSYRVRRQHEVA